MREIPQIIDGIRCHCGCAKNPNHYSLLSCFETSDAMAKDCQGCRKQARYVYELHQAGKVQRVEPVGRRLEHARAELVGVVEPALPVMAGGLVHRTGDGLR